MTEIVIRLRIELPPGMTLVTADADDDRDAYRVPEVATRLGIGRTAVRELIARGELDSILIGGSRCVTPGALRAYLAGLAGRTDA
jgi:excisionase family DNA binding protein